MDVITNSNTNGSTPSKRIEDRFTAAVNVIRGLPKNGNIICIRIFTKNITLHKNKLRISFGLKIFDENKVTIAH